MKKRRLTEKEIELLSLLSQGMSYKDVADLKSRSVNTIKRTAERIRWKLQVSNTVEAVALAIRKGWIE